jgi:hypothetical protein
MAVRILMIPSPSCSVALRWRGLQRKRRTLWFNQNYGSLLRSLVQTASQSAEAVTQRAFGQGETFDQKALTGSRGCASWEDCHDRFALPPSSEALCASPL